MNIDLTSAYQEGYNNLLNWRERYTKHDYPFKIALNIFYRQYSMDNIWESSIISSFNQYHNSETDLIKAYRLLEDKYSQSSQNFTSGNKLTDLMNKQEFVGGLNYKNNIPLIERSRNGDNAANEELEFTYLFYLLTNKAILMWAAFGRLGFEKLEAFSKISGVAINYNKEFSYSNTLGFFGQIIGSDSMNELYKPLKNIY